MLCVCRPTIAHQIGSQAAEALGAIGLPESVALLEKYAKDAAVEVSDTCKLALDRIRFNMEAAKAKEACVLAPLPALQLFLRRSCARVCLMSEWILTCSKETDGKLYESIYHTAVSCSFSALFGQACCG